MSGAEMVNTTVEVAKVIASRDLWKSIIPQIFLGLMQLKTLDFIYAELREGKEISTTVWLVAVGILGGQIGLAQQVIAAHFGMKKEEIRQAGDASLRADTITLADATAGKATRSEGSVPNGE